MDDLQKLLDEERKLSEFRKERWENAELRLERVWNQAVEACREKLGQHTPPCDPAAAMPCWLCWQNAKLIALLRLDSSGYVTVRKRLLNAHKNLLTIWGRDMDQSQSDNYHAGAEDMLSEAINLFGVNE